VQTASRLHFGLLSLAAEGQHWLDRSGQPVLPARRFGGVGLMVTEPGLSLRLERTEAPEWSADGPLAERALDFARQVVESVQREQPGFQSGGHLVVERGAPEHAGLGTGTQLGLAVARVLVRSWGRDESAVQLAARVGRGRRSALGIHGFEQGGFLVDGGQGPRGGISPLVARVAFPEEWRVVLALPAGPGGLSGRGEQEAFQRLLGAAEPSAAVEPLSRLVLLGLLPALLERDLAAFGEALYDFNARAGEAFQAEQGGIHARGAADLVAFLRQQGVRGAGQSSWGPTVFGVVGEPNRADSLAGTLRARLGPQGTVWVTRGCNQGASSGGMRDEG
jgi:beta-RFAP synthase